MSASRSLVAFVCLVLGGLLGSALVAPAQATPSAHTDGSADRQGGARTVWRADTTSIRLSGSTGLAMYADNRTAPSGVGAVGATDQVTYTATLVDGSSAPVTAALVVLEQQLRGEASYTAVGLETTGAKGKARFLVGPIRNARYRASFAGVPDAYDAARSEAVALRVMRDLNAGLWTKPDRKVGLRGNVNPGWDGKRITWQKKSCARCSWRTIDSATTGKTGAWRFQGAYPPRPGKSWYFRAQLPRRVDYVRSVSGLLRTFVTKRRGEVSRTSGSGQGIGVEVLAGSVS